MPLIVIALISFVVNRMSDQKKQAEKRQRQNRPAGHPGSKPSGTTADRPAHRPSSNPPPVVYQDNTESKDISLEPIFTEKPKSLREAAEMLMTQLQPQVEEKKEEAERKVEELKKEAEIYEKKVREVQKRAEAIKGKQKEEPIESLFDKDDIVKGIILSEVLGPPLAKRRRAR